MKKLMITGFDPFGGESVNPSWEAVRRLPEMIGQWCLTKCQLPTVFNVAGQVALAEAERLQPDVILCVGQAGGRNAVTPEVVGINLREARIADNAGVQPTNESVCPEGPAAYFATVPVREMVDAINSVGIPAALSYSAGAFVCNDVLYTLLHRYDGTSVRVGFIHVPFIPEQAKAGEPSLPLEMIVQALKTAVDVL